MLYKNLLLTRHKCRHKKRPRQRLSEPRNRFRNYRKRKKQKTYRTIEIDGFEENIAVTLREDTTITFKTSSEKEKQKPAVIFHKGLAMGRPFMF